MNFLSRKKIHTQKAKWAEMEAEVIPRIVTYSLKCNLALNFFFKFQLYL